MTNYERYKQEISHAAWCGEVAALAGRTCEGAYDCGACMRAVMEWAAKEYVPEVEPGAPVFVSNNGIVWVARRYAGYRPDRGCYLTDGGVLWKYCKERQEGGK